MKGYGSEKSYEQLAQSLQIFGGSGYLQEYPIEQYIRDAKIDTLYEGTTAIQGMDLFFRKIVRDQGSGADPPERPRSRRSWPPAAAASGWRSERELLAAALAEVEAMVERDVRPGGQGAVRTRSRCTWSARTPPASCSRSATWSSAGCCCGRPRSRWQALARRRPKDVPFYTGKVAAAKFFARHILPLLAAQRAIVEATDNALMDVPEEAF